MGDLSPMELYAERVARDAAIGRRRSLDRRLGGPLVWKYLQVVPSVYTARGEFAAFELRVPVDDAVSHLRDSAVLTLDSATEQLGGFRFGRGRHIYAYFGAKTDFDALVSGSIGQRVPGDMMPLLLAGGTQVWLFAVVCENLPPHGEHDGHRVVTAEHLIRDLLGFYGLRRDLLVEIENKLGDVGG